MNVGSWRYQRFHISYGLGFISVGVLAGLSLSAVSNVRFGATLGVFAVVALFGALRSRRWYSMAVLLLAGSILGLYRGGIFYHAIAQYQDYTGQQVRLTGTISDDPQRDGKSQLQFQIGSVRINNKSLPGEIYVSSPSTANLRRGDRVVFDAKLKPGFGSEQAVASFARLVSYTSPSNIIRDVRERFSAAVHRAVPDPEASLGLGFVVGQRSALPVSLDAQLKTVGLTHIVVASGYNLTILVRLARRLFARRSKYLALVTSFAMMLGFLSFSGLSPSMNRAALVTSLSLLAWYYGRRFHPLLLIVYAAAITAVINPIYIWADAGWYLSFLAFGGVLILAPLISAMLFKSRDVPALIQVLIETLSAELVSLPVIALIFGYFPVFGIVANLLVGVTIPFAMLATTVAGTVGIILPAMSFVAGLPASITIGYVISVVHTLSKVNWAQFTANIYSWQVAIWYGILVSIAFWVWRKRAYNFRSSSIVD